MSSEKSPVLIVNSVCDEKDFVNASYFYEKKSGSLKGNYWIIMGFAFLSLVSLLSLFSRLAHNENISYFLRFCLIQALVVVLYAFVIPTFTKSRAKKFFNSSELLKLPFTLSFFEDKLIYENKFESQIFYWTDFLACIENNDFFILKANDRLIIFKKTAIAEKDSMADFLNKVLPIKIDK